MVSACQTGTVELSFSLANELQACSHHSDRHVRVDASPHTADNTANDKLSKPESGELENCADGYQCAADKNGPAAAKRLPESHRQDGTSKAAQIVRGDGNTYRAVS